LSIFFSQPQAREDETIHELHRKKMDRVLFKIDFEKAYDKVKWSFLQQTLRMKGFVPDWCDLISQFVQGGSVGVKVNNDIGHYFQTQKGLRQGDALSPIDKGIDNRAHQLSTPEAH
jgi:hypothetical protein